MRRLDLNKTDTQVLLLLLVLALVAACVSWLALPPRKAGSLWKQPSTFLNRAYGTKALYLSLERMGYEVSRLRRPFEKEMLSRVDSLAILRPILPLKEHETTALEEWVREGHTLLICPSPASGILSASPSEEVQWFNGARVGSGTSETTDPHSIPVKDLPQPLDPLLEGVGEIVSYPLTRFAAQSSLTGSLEGCQADPFLVDEFGVVALRIECGQGHIVAIGDAYPLTNIGISKGDNVLLTANLAHLLGGPEKAHRIAFDEYHLGFGERDPSWLAILRLVFADRWGPGLIQASLAAVLALLAATFRFGRPEDIRVLPRRRETEFAQAAGCFLRKAKATRTVHRTLCDHYRKRACQLLHLDPDVDSSTLERAVEERTGRATDSFSRGANEPEALQRLSEAQLLHSVQNMHEVVETLKHGTRYDRPKDTSD